MSAAALDADGGASTGPDETAELYRRWKDRGDLRARDELVELHRPLAVHLAHRYANRGESRDELVQVAMIGLFKAADRFDPSLGNAFSSFAVPTVLGEIRRHFRDNSRVIRVPRRLEELRRAATDATDRLTAQLGRPATIAEVADELGADEETVLEALESGRVANAGSLDAAQTTGREPGVDGGLAPAQLRLEVRDLMDLLDERERRIVYLRFFEDKTQSEIAEEMGLSQMHVSRLLRQSIELMRSGSPG